MLLSVLHILSSVKKFSASFSFLFYCLPTKKNIWNIKDTQKIFEILATQTINIFKKDIRRLSNT